MKAIYVGLRGVSGVYSVVCKINNKRYVGSSVNVGARLCNHFNRDAKKYQNKEFYKDVLKYGRSAFVWELLEKCERENLIERERFYFDKLKPEYNFMRPEYCSFCSQMVRDKARETCRSKEFREKKSRQYSTDYYRNLFSSIQNERKRKVNMYSKDGFFITSFNSMMDCQRYLNEHTDFVGKNKVSKIKAVCEKERPSAFGFYFEYVKTSND